MISRILCFAMNSNSSIAVNVLEFFDIEKAAEHKTSWGGGQ